jgi:hypothetical protein
MSENEQNYARAENSELAQEEPTLKDLLDELVIEAVTSSTSAYGIPGTLSTEQPIFDLLAAKDARIAELEARQVTPEMVSVWEELQEMKRTQSARFVVNSQADLRSDLWHAFIAMMESRECDHD